MYMQSPERTDIAEFITQEVQSHQKDIVAVVAKQFGISRQRANDHVKREIKKGTIIKTGRTRATKYFLSSADSFDFLLKLEPGLKEDEVWTKYCKARLSTYPPNVYTICNYGFTEILNNAIDHSEGKEIHCTISITKSSIHMTVMDDGIGIFKKIQNALGLSSIREAILHLSKGKFTTDPSRHTGQGIFFTSRMMDNFCIMSGGLYFSFRKDDWLLSEERSSDAHNKGTYVKMEIAITSPKEARKILDEYSDVETGFHKTIVAVALSADPDDPHVSRSQAKRLLIGLERFKNIVLDFKDVKGIGQAFVDEIFRVFQNEHPEIRITFVNANEDVQFMIKSGLANT